MLYFSSNLQLPAHTSFQKRVSFPLPTIFLTFSPIQSTSSPLSNPTFPRSLHQTDPIWNLSTPLKLLKSPYFALTTLTHKLFLSTNNLHLHLPRSATFTKAISLTPKPPSSFDLQTVSHVTHAILRSFSLPLLRTSAHCANS